MPDLTQIEQATGAKLEATTEYERHRNHTPWNAIDYMPADTVNRANAMRDELLARIEELTAENADLRLNMTKDGLLVRMQEANQNGYECGRSLAEAERFMLEKERDAEKQRADEYKLKNEVASDNLALYAMEARDAIAECRHEKQRADEAEAALAKRNDQYEVLQAAYEGAKEATELHPLPPLVDAHLRFGRVDPLERGDLIADLEAKLAAAEAQVERLKCCGSCRWCDSVEYLNCTHEDVPTNMMGEFYVSLDDRCHHEPSRWTARSTP